MDYLEVISKSLPQHTQSLSTGRSSNNKYDLRIEQIISTSMEVAEELCNRIEQLQKKARSGKLGQLIAAVEMGGKDEHFKRLQRRLDELRHDLLLVTTVLIQ